MKTKKTSALDYYCCLRETAYKQIEANTFCNFSIQNSLGSS